MTTKTTTASGPCACSLISIEVGADRVPASMNRYIWENTMSDLILATGCTQTTKSTFAQGHDAKAKALLQFAYRNGLDVRSDYQSDGLASYAEATVAAREIGCSSRLLAQITKSNEPTKPTEGTTPRPTKKTAKATPADALDQFIMHETFTTTPPVTPQEQAELVYADIKVGRWTYRDALITRTGATYKDKTGETHHTAKYSLV